MQTIPRPACHTPAQEDDPAEDLNLVETLSVAVHREKKPTLSAQEWKSLRRLASTPGMAVPREELNALLWGDDPLLHHSELNRYIEQLNHKLSDSWTAPACIQVVSGGFRLTAPDS